MAEKYPTNPNATIPVYTVDSSSDEEVSAQVVIIIILKDFKNL